MLEWSIAFYFVFCLVYGLLSIWRKWEKGFINTCIIVFIPVLGIVVAFFMMRSDRNKKGILEAAVAVAQDGEMDTGLIPFEQQKGNYIPIQDALLLKNNQTKRQLLLEMLRRDSVPNIGILKKAIENEDTETSHYAATAIMEIQREMINTLNKLASIMEEKPDDYDVMERFAETIKEYLHSGFGDKFINRRFQMQLSMILETLLENHQYNRQHFIDKLHCDLALENYEKAQIYCHKFIKAYPSDEISYLMAVKVYYTLQNREELKRAILLLKKQPIQLSLEGLYIIRFWTQEENHERSF